MEEESPFRNTCCTQTPYFKTKLDWHDLESTPWKPATKVAAKFQIPPVSPSKLRT